MRMSRFGLATAAVAAACLSAPALADGLYGDSLKDPEVVIGSRGYCYLRADTGYSWSANPDVRWTVRDADPGSPTFGQVLTDAVTGVGIGNTWLVEGGIGCASGSRGLRGDLMLGYHGKRTIDGVPGPWNGAVLPPTADPLHTGVSSTTLMFNGYYDILQFGRFTPYLGAGLGLAYNKTDAVSFTGPANVISGDSRWSLAWSLMAGVGISLTERTTLDIGYRYLDVGRAESGTIDNLGNAFPKVRIDDLAAHEFKIGLRMAFGGGEPCCNMK